MLTIIAVLLNLPWAISGFIGALLSGPRKLTVSKKPFALVFYVRSFWWYRWLPGQGGVRGMANGWCIQLGPEADLSDLHHELIHVEQAERQPFVHQILYAAESFKNGYRHNRFEEEAYTRSGSRYTGDDR